jgi:hypothetical protein
MADQATKNPQQQRQQQAAQPQTTEQPRQQPGGDPAQAPAPPAQGSRNWREEAFAFLESKSWKSLGWSEAGNAVWADPNGRAQNVTTKRRVELPTKERGQGPNVIFQVVGPPCDWNYSTEDAMVVQRSRDLAAEQEANPPAPLTLAQAEQVRKAELARQEAIHPRKS